MTSFEPTARSEPHSAHWLRQDFRSSWWDRDHLALIAARVGLSTVRRALDVGCGVGHWTFLLASVLDPRTEFVGIDMESEWIERVTQRAAERGLARRMSFERGDAMNLPFEDESFDLVTCQTVLMHLPDPKAAIAEMIRVTRPGGVLLASEPNNRIQHLIQTSTNADAPVDELVDLVRFGLMCERGKANLGEGNDSIGNLVPGYFAQSGLDQVSAVVSEKTPVVYPPYASEEQQILRDHALDLEAWVGVRATLRRYFLAGGGTESEFDSAWNRRVGEHERVAGAIRDGTFHTAGGFSLYLTWGRRPT